MRRFTLFQMLAGVAAFAIVVALLQVVGSSRAYTKIHSLAFSPDGKRLAVVKLDWWDANVPLRHCTADITRTVSVADVEAAKPAIVVDQDYRAGDRWIATDFLRQAPESFAFSADGNVLHLLEFGGGKIQSRDLRSGAVSDLFDPGAEKEVTNFAVSPDRTIVAANIWNGGVRLFWFDDAKKRVANPRIDAFSPFKPGFGVSADNRWVGILDIQYLYLYDVTKKLRAGATIPCSGAFAFGPYADQLAIADVAGISLYDPISGTLSRVPSTKEIHNVKYLNSETLVLATADEVMLLEIASGNVTQRVSVQSWVTALATSPDHTTVAFGDIHGELVLWNTATGKLSTRRVPGVHHIPWKLPAGILAVLVALYFCSRAV